MITKNQEKSRKQITIVCIDDLVPENHLLRKIDKAIDWNFIYELAKNMYSQDKRRPSIYPIILIKILFIKYIYGIRSMRQTIKEIEVNVAYRWFLGLVNLIYTKIRYVDSTPLKACANSIKYEKKLTKEKSMFF